LKAKSDFTGNGTSDVLWINPTNDIVDDWLMNNGTPTWQVVGQGSPTVNIAGVGDFNGTGKDDIPWQNPTNNYVGRRRRWPRYWWRGWRSGTPAPCSPQG
jgi:hypothetical protein